tara:strand:- start:6922 stop:7506 length:585 start_codon:yes stop_codon:yes gene_type:complete
VVLIDADPARSVMSWSRKKALVPHLQVQASGGHHMIRDEINDARAQAPFVILDLEGAVTRLNAYAMAESDLVIIPMGDEQQEAEAAIETLAELKRMTRALDRDIPARILFSRTQRKADKSPLERSLNDQMRGRVECFEQELTRWPAFSALHSYGGTILGLGKDRVPDAPRASAYASIFADEVKAVTNDLARIQL